MTPIEQSKKQEAQLETIRKEYAEIKEIISIILTRLIS